MYDWSYWGKTSDEVYVAYQKMLKKSALNRLMVLCDTNLLPAKLIPLGVKTDYPGNCYAVPEQWAGGKIRQVVQVLVLCGLQPHPERAMPGWMREVIWGK